MASLRRFCYASAVVFALAARVQLVRAASGFPLQVDGWLVPRAASLVAGLVAAGLAAWAVAAARAARG